MSYNGHKNWNMWNVSLWINNDEGLYDLARDYVKRTRTKDIAASEMAKHLRGQKTPDGANYSKTAIRAAMVEM